MRNYERDYAGWAEDTAQAITEQRWSEIDAKSLADEVGDLARKERRALRHRYAVLFLHLLKQRHQPMLASRSWEATILEQRIRLQDLLSDSPSLRADETTAEVRAAAYRLARVQAMRETGLPLETFPETLPFNEQDIWGELDGRLER